MTGEPGGYHGAVRSLALLRAAHPGPTVAVTAITGLLAVGAELSWSRVLTVVGAVSTGQLVIGWINDAVDAGRDRQVGRLDKPVATGEIGVAAVGAAAGVALGVTVVLSSLLGWRAGAVQVALVVGSGVAYDLVLKRSWWSWLPYAVAFGSLPAVVTLAEDPPIGPQWEAIAGGAALGVGAHLVNVLPDLADDAATGVRGFPHRIGARAAQRAAALVLLAASITLVAASGSPSSVMGGGLSWAPSWALSWAVLGVVAGLACVVAAGRGRTPFRAAVLMAVIDVVLLVTAGAGTPLRAGEG